MAKAKQLLEDVYDARISSKGSYEASLASLALTGRLAEKSKLITVVIRLCEIVDAQQEQINSLKGIPSQQP